MIFLNQNYGEFGRDCAENRSVDDNVAQFVVIENNGNMQRHIGINIH